MIEEKKYMLSTTEMQEVLIDHLGIREEIRQKEVLPVIEFFDGNNGKNKVDIGCVEISYINEVKPKSNIFKEESK